jgi:hypothetical protein
LLGTLRKKYETDYTSYNIRVHIADFTSSRYALYTFCIYA